MQRFALTVVAIAAPFILLSCSSAESPVEILNAVSDQPSLPQPAALTQTPTGFEGITAVIDVQIDVTNMEAGVSRPRSAQMPQALSYDLDIENFLTADTFRVTGLSQDTDGNLIVAYTHAHPFPAPDFANPITGLNRADLGYTGRLLVLADEESVSFINGEITTMPGFVLNADGYMQPGDLLAVTGHSNDTFPYKLLVDEARDNRVGVSNGGTPEGNYGGALGGWQRTNIGASADGWTGFDFLHGGQRAANTLVINAGKLNGGVIDFSVAILIKYTDPRGEGGKTFRFPPEIPVITEFAYRLPFAALDNAVIGPKAPWAIGAAAATTSDVELIIRDWDTRADEAGDSDLSDEQDVTLVPPGASGIPRVFLEVPALMNTSIQMTGLRGTGIPGDEMEFGGTLTNDNEPPIGTVYGIVKVIDNEDGIDRSSYHFGVDPFTVEPTRTAHDLVTYQIIPIRIGEIVPEIISVSPQNVTGLPGTEVTFSANVTGSPAIYEWFFGEGTIPTTSMDESPTVLLNRSGTHFGTLRVSNTDGTSDAFTFEYLVDTPGDPFAYTEHNTEIPHVRNPVILFPGGLPAVVYCEDDTFDFIRIAMSSVEDPTSGADWSVHNTGTGWLRSALGDYRNFMDATVHNDSIAVVNSTGGIAISDSLTPASSADWAFHIYDNGAGRSPSVISFDTHLVIAYGEETTDTNGECKIAVSRNSNPDSTSDWDIHLVAGAVGSTPTYTFNHDLSVSLDGTITLLFKIRFDRDAVTRLMISETTTPEALGDWRSEYTRGHSFRLGAASVLPIHNRYIVYNPGGDTLMSVSFPYVPGEFLTWHEYSFPFTTFILDSAMVDWQDRPAIFVTSESFAEPNYWAIRGQTAIPERAIDWDADRELNHSSTFPTMSLGDIALRDNEITRATLLNFGDTLRWATTSDTW